MSAPVVRRIAKACEPCRLRKIRCEGARPCSHCEARQTECVYREYVRKRKRVTQSSNSTAPSPASPESSHLINNGDDQDAEETSTHVHQSVSATDTHPLFGSSQLYYGASSNFAFHQQIHGSILLRNQLESPLFEQTHEGAAGFEVSLQRNLFFGTESSTNPRTSLAGSDLANEPTLPQALCFLEDFKITTLQILPFFSQSDLDILVHSLFDRDLGRSLHPQARVLALAVLANGALGSHNVPAGELLFSKAKIEAINFDDLVNLHMIQFSMLLAEYQKNMGRPNSSFLHLGNASRKAFAMGLHRDLSSPVNILGWDDELERRRSTIWYLCILECWQALWLGRKSFMSLSDLSCPLPKNQSLAGPFRQLAGIVEESVRTIYAPRQKNLREVCDDAEKINEALQQFSSQHKIGDVIPSSDKFDNQVGLVTLHNMYYHTILLTFRPFIIAQSERNSLDSTHINATKQRNSSSFDKDDLWLRKACRRAIGAAQDYIVYIHRTMNSLEACKKLPYNAFFIESCSSLLLYDIIWHKYTYSHNLEYIKMGIQCLSSMGDTEPMGTAKKSILHMLRIIDQCIMQDVRLTEDGLPSLDEESPDMRTIARIPFNDATNHQWMHIPIEDPAFSGNFFRFGDNRHNSANVSELNSSFDILTTDLSHQFSLYSGDDDTILG